MSAIPNGYPASAAEAFAVLQSRDRLSIDELKVLVMIEQSGEAFYMAMARAAGNAEARALLEQNAHEELGHAHRALNAIRLLGGTFALPKVEENPFALPAFFDDLDITFLSELIKGEEGGDASYQKWADNEPNPDVAGLYRLNGSEETGHGQRVAKVIALLQ
jgi:rubrerythrin